jgi:hypothetical protein
MEGLEADFVGRHLSGQEAGQRVVRRGAQKLQLHQPVGRTAFLASRRAKRLVSQLLLLLLLGNRAVKRAPLWARPAGRHALGRNFYRAE